MARRATIYPQMLMPMASSMFLDFAAVAAGVDAAGGLPQQGLEAALLAAAAQAGDIEPIAGAPVIGFSKRSEVLPGVTVY